MLFDILACPTCKVHLARSDDHLLCNQCGMNYPIVNGVPIMLTDGNIPEYQHFSDLTVRQSYDPWVHRIILQSLLDHQVVVDIGSGNMELDDPCIIQMDIALTPYVDLVADVHNLPFLPESIDYILSLSVVEHLRNSFLAAQSIYNALKDGGFVYHECNFIIPYHGFPHHYFNGSLGISVVPARYRGAAKEPLGVKLPTKLIGK